MTVCKTSQKKLKHSFRYEFRIVMRFRNKLLNLRITVSAKKVESEIVPKFLKLSFQLQQVGIGETTSDHNNQQTRFIYTSIQTEFTHVLPIM